MRLACIALLLLAAAAAVQSEATWSESKYADSAVHRLTAAAGEPQMLGVGGCVLTRRACEGLRGYMKPYQQRLCAALLGGSRSGTVGFMLLP